MSGINYTTGDATRPQVPGPKIICHVCNDLGRWGSGFVIAISRRWSAPEAAYRIWHARGSAGAFQLGTMQLVQVEADVWVANLVAQRGAGSPDGTPPIRYDALESCLHHLVPTALAMGASLHMPRIGCGRAGGRWSEVEPLLERHLVNAGLAVTVYDLG